MGISSNHLYDTRPARAHRFELKGENSYLLVLIILSISARRCTRYMGVVVTLEALFSSKWPHEPDTDLTMMSLQLKGTECIDKSEKGLSEPEVGLRYVLQMTG